MAPNNKKYEIADDLILEKDTVYDCDLKVSGNILGKDGNKYSLTVKGNISARNISAWNISAGNITADDISARNITAGNITAGDITAGDITAGDITAWDITAWGITAGDITAWDITAWGITADDISYYAVCWAYYNIKCKSIVGRREHARHFVLDGKVTVKRVD